MLKELALQFALHGAKAVILMSRDKVKNQEVVDDIQAQAPACQCLSMPGNIIYMDQCKSIVKDVVDKFGRVDILVNGAGGNFFAMAETISPNAVRRVMEIDIMGTFHMS